MGRNDTKNTYLRLMLNPKLKIVKTNQCFISV